MTKPTTHGHTQSGRPITDRTSKSLAAEAEAGYDVETLIARRNKRGRPTLGASPRAWSQFGWTPSYGRNCSTEPSPKEQPPPN